MPIEEIATSPADTAAEIITAIGSIGNWLQALGLIVVIWIIIQFINWFINRKRLKELLSIKEDIARIEKKIDKLSKK